MGSVHLSCRCTALRCNLQGVARVAGSAAGRRTGAGRQRPDRRQAPTTFGGWRGAATEIVIRRGMGPRTASQKQKSEARRECGVSKKSRSRSGHVRFIVGISTKQMTRRNCNNEESKGVKIDRGRATNSMQRNKIHGYVLQIHRYVIRSACHRLGVSEKQAQHRVHVFQTVAVDPFGLPQQMNRKLAGIVRR